MNSWEQNKCIDDYLLRIDKLNEEETKDFIKQTGYSWEIDVSELRKVEIIQILKEDSPYITCLVNDKNNMSKFDSVETLDRQNQFIIVDIFEDTIFKLAAAGESKIIVGDELRFFYPKTN